MAEISIDIPQPINESCQVGDIAYYITASTISGGFTINQETDEIVEIGPITEILLDNTDGATDEPSIDPLYYRIKCNTNGSIPSQYDFIFFGKDRSVNESSITGYYGSFNFVNNSKEKAELFSTACEITESSK
tara:strand:+ start:38 stop:436 length:399 start_codon:yes stop_codon:yes gene_type:complete